MSSLSLYLRERRPTKVTRPEGPSGLSDGGVASCIQVHRGDEMMGWQSFNVISWTFAPWPLTSACSVGTESCLLFRLSHRAEWVTLETPGTSAPTQPLFRFLPSISWCRVIGWSHYLCPLSLNLPVWDQFLETLRILRENI